MKKNIYKMFMILLCCNGCSDDNIRTTLCATSSIINMPSNEIIEQTNPSYIVSEEDVCKFSNAVRPQHDFTVDTYAIDKDTLLYLINYDSGWIIVSGDKRINPIVAESQTGKLSFKNDNTNLQAWIDSYADEIRVLRNLSEHVDNEYTRLWDKIIKNRNDKGKSSKASAKRYDDYKWCVISTTYCDSTYYTITIPHLISTKWGQRYPWNTKCPIDTASWNRCPTGCVAVSLAQIIYHMHSRLGKPNGLYHNISVASTYINGSTINIGFSRSNYNSNSTRWSDMPLYTYGAGYSEYVGDLMLDIGNRVGMSYSGTVSLASLSTSALSYYDLTYSQSSYNLQTVKSDLQNSKPVNITAINTQNNGHSWIIDGLVAKKSHWMNAISFEYSENLSNTLAYYDTFEQLQQAWNIQDPSEVLYSDGGTTSVDYLLMNWGYDGLYDDGYFSSYPSDSWQAGDTNYLYNKTIYYDFR